MLRMTSSADSEVDFIAPVVQLTKAEVIWLLLTDLITEAPAIFALTFLPGEHAIWHEQITASSAFTVELTVRLLTHLLYL